MELGLGFADDDLQGDNKEVERCLTSYNAKICHPKWFLTAEGDDNEARANIKKYQADYHYGNKDYSQAAQLYTDALASLSSQNRVMRKDMMESLSRCYCYTGEETKALKLIAELMSDATTMDNRVQVLLLQQLVLNHFGRGQDMPGQTVQTLIRLLLEEQSDQGLHCLPFRLHRLDSLLYEETKVIQQLIGYHPYNAQFWLMLMKAYRRLLADDCQSKVHTNRANNSALPQDGVHLEKKLQETLTLASSETRKIQFISNETKTKQQHNSGDGIVEHLLEDKSTENCEHCSGCDKISQENSVHSETLSENCTLASSIGEDTATNPRNNSGNTHESPYPLKLKLLTCCIKTSTQVSDTGPMVLWFHDRLLLRSVHSTVGSFIKTRSQELLTQVEQVLEALCLEGSIIQAASEHITRNFCQSSDMEDDEDTESRHQSTNKVSVGAVDDFDEKWFGWIKNI